MSDKLEFAKEKLLQKVEANRNNEKNVKKIISNLKAYKYSNFFIDDLDSAETYLSISTDGDTLSSEKMQQLIKILEGAKYDNLNSCDVQLSLYYTAEDYETSVSAVLGFDKKTANDLYSLSNLE